MVAKALVLSAVAAVAVADTTLPEDIEALVCKVATSKDIENKETAKVCKVITTKWPAIQFQPDCPTVVTGMWDAVAAKCPQPEKNLTEEGIPAGLEKLVCMLASKKEIEDRASGAVCKAVLKKWPVMKEADCEAKVDKLWDVLEAKCPKMRLTATPVDDIEKLVCKLASVKEIEDKETAKMCVLMKEKAPWFQFQPDCKTVVEGVWDAVVAKCPKMNEPRFYDMIEAGPTPEEQDQDDIEKLVCELLSQKEIEDKETAKVCKLFKEKIPFFHFEPACQTQMEGIWDSVIAKCPKTANKVIVV